eukprot:1047008-Karenia_brevis.AAC.1
MASMISFRQPSQLVMIGHLVIMRKLEGIMLALQQQLSTDRSSDTVRLWLLNLQQLPAAFRR